MRNMQKLSSKAQSKLTLRSAVVFLFGGLGAVFVLTLIGFLLYNLGSSDKSIAAGSISSVKTGLWVDNNTWNQKRRPGNHEEIIIAHKEEVTINHNLYLEKVTIKVYGTLKLKNSNLRLDETSTILIAKSGKLINEGPASNMLIIGDQPWIGSQINAIGAPAQLTSSGASSVDLLPVELSYFKGAAIDGHSVLLEWSTRSELNNSHFTIEKKVGESDFIFVDTVRGAGNSNHELLYSYEDKHVFAPSVYYRLKQTDFNGDFKYFNIINVTTDKALQSVNPSVKIVQAGPNPFTDKFILLYNSYNVHPIALKISTLNGKVVHQEELMPTTGQNEYVLSENIYLEAGVYIVTLTQNGRSDFVRMIKK